MMSFWSYKNEYKKYNTKLRKIFDKTLRKGQIFFVKTFQSLKITLKKNIERSLALQ